MTFGPDNVAACQVCGEEFTGSTAYSQRAKHRKAEHPDAVPGTASGAVAGEETPPLLAGPPPEKVRLRDRIKKKAPARVGHPKERAPQRGPRKRADTGWLASAAWGGLANALGGQGYAATSMSLKFETGMVAAAFDETIRGTIIDKAIQPVARLGEDGKRFGAMVALPAMTLVCERDPAKLGLLYPGIRRAFIELLPLFVDEVKKQIKAEAKLAVDLSDIAPYLGMPEGSTPSVDDVLRFWLAGPMMRYEAMAAEARETAAA